MDVLWGRCYLLPDFSYVFKRLLTDDIEAKDVLPEEELFVLVKNMSKPLIATCLKLWDAMSDCLKPTTPAVKLIDKGASLMALPKLYR